MDNPNLNPKTPFQKTIQDIFRDLGIEEEFMQASDHHSRCRCNLCLDWWRKMAFEEDGVWDTGPFTYEELFGE